MFAMTGAETEQLRAMIQQGMDSGIAGELDIEAVKRRGRQRLRAEGKLYGVYGAVYIFEPSTGRC